MRILVDLDATLVDSLPHWLRHIHHETGVGAQIGDIVSWNMAECPPLDRLAPAEIYDWLQRPGFIATAPIMHGAQEAMDEFTAAGDKVYIVTARSGPVSVPETYIWLKYHLPVFDYKNVIFCYDKHLIDADVLIEDKVETLEKYAEAHPTSLRVGIQYPYNLHVRPETAQMFPYSPLAWQNIAKWVHQYRKLVRP